MDAVLSFDLGRLRKRAAQLFFAVSVAWMIWTMAGGMSHFVHLLLQVGVLGIALVVLDVLWLVGMAIQIVAAGQALQLGKTPRAFLRSVNRIRQTRIETFERIVRSRALRVGFWLNAFAAFSFAVIAPIAVFVGIPRPMWLSFLLFLAADTTMTIGRVLPQKRIMDQKLGKLAVHTAKPEDLDGYLEAQRVSWGDDMAADRRKLESRFNVFPRGIFIAERFGRVVGAVTTIRIDDYHEDSTKSWHEITNDGWCDTHNPKGKVMFGVDMSATEDAPPGVHDDLLVRCMHQVVTDGLKAGVLGGRMPEYHKYAHLMKPDEYLWAKRGDGKHLDPQVRMYAAVPNLKVIGVLPNYFDDPQSCNNGVLLIWRNPFYRWPGRRFWAWVVLKAVQADNALSTWRKKFRGNKGRP